MVELFTEETPIPPCETPPLTRQVTPTTFDNLALVRPQTMHFEPSPDSPTSISLDVGRITTTRTVTTTTTTTTTVQYPPIVLKPPPTQVLKDPKTYPLSGLRLPESWKSFDVTLGGKQVHCEESEDGKLQASVAVLQYAEESIAPSLSDKRQPNHLRRLATNRSTRLPPRRIETDTDLFNSNIQQRKRKRIEISTTDIGALDDYDIRGTPTPDSRPKDGQSTLLSGKSTSSPIRGSAMMQRSHVSHPHSHLKVNATTPRSPITTLPLKRRAMTNNAEDAVSSSDEADSLPGEPTNEIPTIQTTTTELPDADKLPPSPIYSPAETVDIPSGIAGVSRVDEELARSMAGRDRNRRNLTGLPMNDHSSVVPLATLMQLPTMLSFFDSLPSSLQSYMLLQLMRRSPASTLQFVSSIVLPALKRDFLTLLPMEIALTVLDYLDAKTLSRAARVSRKWRSLVDGDAGLWRRRGVRDNFWDEGAMPDTVEVGVMMKEEHKIKQEEDIIKQEESTEMEMCPTGSPGDTAMTDTTSQREGPSFKSKRQAANPYKYLYARTHVLRSNWYAGKCKVRNFSGHDNNVVTCLQFDSEKIVSGSDDHSIHIYNIKTGEMIKALEGHEGGVWGLQYVGNTLVSGSTDRTVRVWDMAEGKCTHVFGGHVSTVRCLQIIQPMDPETARAAEKESGGVVKQPPYPLIATGSRDMTLRVWKLPDPKTDPHYHSAADVGEGGSQRANPFFLHELRGHTHSVRAVAGHGTILCSGSYDTNVRVWNVMTGECLWRLQGHTQKVYSIVFDGHTKCWSGSMDATVRCWDITNGDCLATLSGHSSLVGLLQFTPSHLISAAADSTLRVWDPRTNELSHTLSAHTGAITCFQHDRYKVVSGSEGTIKLWDLQTGETIRDLVSDLSGVWLLRIDMRYCVAAVQRNQKTEFVVLDFDVPWDGEGDLGVEELVPMESESPVGGAEDMDRMYGSGSTSQAEPRASTSTAATAPVVSNGPASASSSRSESMTGSFLERSRGLREESTRLVAAEVRRRTEEARTLVMSGLGEEHPAASE